MGASEIIGKTAGVISLVAIIFVMLMPIIKIFIIILSTSILIAFAQALNLDDKIIKLIEGFSSTFKTIIGVLIATSITFIVSFAVIISLLRKIVS